jgi:hypothetical protein
MLWLIALQLNPRIGYRDVYFTESYLVLLDTKCEPYVNVAD